jgi:hypothetical protein
LGRENNQFADALATLAFVAQINCGDRVQPICIKIRNSLTYYCSVEEESIRSLGTLK